MRSFLRLIIQEGVFSPRSRPKAVKGKTGKKGGKKYRVLRGIKLDYNMSVQGHVREEARRKMDGRKRGLKGRGKGDWKNGARDGDRREG